MWSCRTLYVSQFLKKLTEPSILLWITVHPPGSCLWSHHTCISRLAFSGFTRYMPLLVWPSSRACRQSLKGPEKKYGQFCPLNPCYVILVQHCLKNEQREIVPQRVCILWHRESHFSTGALLILTVKLTLAAPLRREMAAGCAAKRNTGMRAKGILTIEWWNSSRTFRSSVMLGSAELLFYFFHLSFYVLY